MKNIRVSEKMHDKLKSYTKKEGVKIIDFVEGVINEFFRERVERFENINFDEDIYLVFRSNQSVCFPNSLFVRFNEKMYGTLHEVLYQKANKDIVLVSVSDDGELEDEVKEIYYDLSGGRLLGRIKVIKMTYDEFNQLKNNFEKLFEV